MSTEDDDDLDPVTEQQSVDSVDSALDTAKRAVTAALAEAEASLRSVRRQRDDLNKQIKPLHQRVLDLRRVSNGFTPRKINKKPKPTG